MTLPKPNEDVVRKAVEESLREVLGGQVQIPADDEDWVLSGLLDSMAHTEVLMSIEEKLGLGNLFGPTDGKLLSNLHEIVLATIAPNNLSAASGEVLRGPTDRPAGYLTAVIGWGSAAGDRRVTAAELEREFGLKTGKIADSAAIETVARIRDGEDELALALRAADAALVCGRAKVSDLDCIIATSETHVGYPSLGARLHAELRAHERTAVMDVGGACLGVVNALAVAQQFIASGRFGTALIVTADVHSRLLIPDRVKGEFGALFGDGASSLIVCAAEDDKSRHYSVRAVTLGCDASGADFIRVGLDRTNEVHGVQLSFDGPALSRAALSRLKALIEELERTTEISRADASGFATHQPNPGLVGVLARQLGVSVEKFPPVARTYGNLGSSTCGVALAHTLSAAGDAGRNAGPIFVASLGPGLLFGGTVLS